MRSGRSGGSPGLLHNAPDGPGLPPQLVALAAEYHGAFLCPLEAASDGSSVHLGQVQRPTVTVNPGTRQHVQELGSQQQYQARDHGISPGGYVRRGFPHPALSSNDRVITEEGNDRAWIGRVSVLCHRQRDRARSARWPPCPPERLIDLFRRCHWGRPVLLPILAQTGPRQA